MRTIGVVTTSRADYGIYRPILRRIQDQPELRLHLMATGMHLCPEFGETVNEITADGFEICERVQMLMASDSPEGISQSIGLGILGFAQVFARFHPDILLVLGDRFEMFAATAAALPFNIPIAHVHGGEVTEGAIDDAIRHSITKMSHLHFVAAEAYRDRVVQMGEAPGRVTVSGAPSLDNIKQLDILSRDEMASRVGMDLSAEPLLITFHPTTREYLATSDQVSQLLGALHHIGLPAVFTYPNADTYGRTILEAFKEYVSTHPNARLVQNLGTQAYFSMMRYAKAMVGNSSSGIIEAASFGLPVINIGSRQRGRMHGRNVIDVDCTAQSIIEVLQMVLDPVRSADFRESKNPYGNGNAAERIVEVLRSVPLTPALLCKSFYDISHPLGNA
jgi:UDP-N-acetylglucosamine 2-epimerase (non-hydrolysing)/GDP/UDP-N,N'-diacetylbacillosamine 2-epimerase (hydrolysing)